MDHGKNRIFFSFIGEEKDERNQNFNNSLVVNNNRKSRSKSPCLLSSYNWFSKKVPKYGINPEFSRSKSRGKRKQERSYTPEFNSNPLKRKINSKKKSNFSQYKTRKFYSKNNPLRVRLKPRKNSVKRKAKRSVSPLDLRPFSKEKKKI